MKVIKKELKFLKTDFTRKNDELCLTLDISNKTIITF